MAEKVRTVAREGAVIVFRLLVSLIQLSLFFCFFSVAKNSFALSCVTPVPTTMDIIRAPVIFNGTVTEFIVHSDEDGTFVKKDIRFRVNKNYKGATEEYIDIKSVPIMGYGPNLGVGSTKTIIPDVLRDGVLAISYCSSGLRNQKSWEGKVRYAYEKPFPVLYLLWNSYKYRLIIMLIFVPAFFITFVNIFKITTDKPKLRYVLITAFAVLTALVFFIPSPSHNTFSKLNWFEIFLIKISFSSIIFSLIFGFWLSLFYFLFGLKKVKNGCAD